MSSQNILMSAAGASSAPATYIEDVFSTYLYTGNGSTQTITNGIDLAGKGGLVWMKGRSGATDHGWYDTARGATFDIGSNLTTAQTTQSSGLTSFSSTGFSLGALAKLNTNAATYTSWTFRKQPKFFDVVTFTEGAAAFQTVNHSLGSVPGVIIIKPVSTAGAWYLYHQDLGTNKFLLPYSTAAAGNGIVISSTSSTSFDWYRGNVGVGVGTTWVAYVFAHNAGGFGLTGTDNVISCGSYTGNGSATGPTVTLGYEPQWLMIKNASGTGSWQIIDNMRGMPVGSVDATLQANLSNAESSTDYVTPTATGFQIVSTSTEVNTNASTYIYIAIRRGLMKVPTDGTKVFAPIVYTGNSTAQTQRNSGILTDMVWSQNRGGGAYPADFDRLRGATQLLSQSRAVAEVTLTGSGLGVYGFDTMDGYIAGADQSYANINYNGASYVNWIFKRASGFFDEVCYTGAGSAATISHNLGVVPELIFVKRRSGSADWYVYSQSTGNSNTLFLDGPNASAASSAWNYTDPTSSTFSVGALTGVSVGNLVAYLFASCPGVSKVGSYTGTGAAQTIDCGFTGGARFVLIKRTDSTGDWYVWDTARGIVAANDPRLSLNTTTTEVTTDDSIDPDSSGFIVNQVTATNINVSSATYIYLAIA